VVLPSMTCESDLIPVASSQKMVSMEIQGRVHNGVVIPERELLLPEGTLVTVVYPIALETKPPDCGRRVRLPLVRSDHPGSRELEADRVAELLDDDDVPS
jgi:hypothetical protein